MLSRVTSANVSEDGKYARSPGCTCTPDMRNMCLVDFSQHFFSHKVQRNAPPSPKIKILLLYRRTL
ncbi:unnamed protein product [Ectocarpus sp. 8 AP-2014]